MKLTILRSNARLRENVWDFVVISEHKWWRLFEGNIETLNIGMYKFPIKKNSLFIFLRLKTHDFSFSCLAMSFLFNKTILSLLKFWKKFAFRNFESRKRPSITTATDQLVFQVQTCYMFMRSMRSSGCLQDFVNDFLLISLRSVFNFSSFCTMCPCWNLIFQMKVRH